MTFKELRRERGLSFAELAEAARVSESTIRKLERGYVPSHTLVCESIASALGTTAADLWPDTC